MRDDGEGRASREDADDRRARDGGAGMSFAQRVECALRALANPVFFALRSRLRFRRAGYRETRETPLTDPVAIATLQRFGLTDLTERMRASTLATTLHVVDLLDAVFERHAPPTATPLRVLDVGSKNFEVAPALLASLAAHRGRRDAIELTGIELDAYRVYADGHSRADAAAYFLALAAEVGLGRSHRFIAGDVLEHRERYDVITWFHPFVTPAPLLRWGLPLRHLAPERMLEHVASLRAPGGLLVIVNQEPEEAAIQRELFARVGLEATSFEVPSRFPRRHATCPVHVVKKGSAPASF
ncbi:MAG: hypothetical protein IT459_12780 [Planctomycetes bacterium]|nr:hypothetical protein [Planctomycetota bacterium]